MVHLSNSATIPLVMERFLDYVKRTVARDGLNFDQAVAAVLPSLLACSFLRRLENVSEHDTI